LKKGGKCPAGCSFFETRYFLPLQPCFADKFFQTGHFAAERPVMPRPGDKNIAAHITEWVLLFLTLEMGSQL
jgi:hypothetical protein